MQTIYAVLYRLYRRLLAKYKWYTRKSPVNRITSRLPDPAELSRQRAEEQEIKRRYKLVVRSTCNGQPRIDTARFNSAEPCYLLVDGFLKEHGEGTSTLHAAEIWHEGKGMMELVPDGTLFRWVSFEE